MNRKKRAWARRAFVLAFIALTSLCWCPWAYGTVGGRTFSIPTWAVLAYVVAAALVVLEWIFLVPSGLAVSDEELGAILSELDAFDADGDPAAEEDR